MMLKRLIRRLHFTHLGALLRLRVADPRTRNAPFVLFDDRTWTYTQSYDEALRFAHLFRAIRDRHVAQGRLVRGEQLRIPAFGARRLPPCWRRPRWRFC